MISMRGSKSFGFQVAAAAVLSAAVAIGTFACAGAGSPPSDSAAAPSEVVDVLVESGDGGTTITVVGPVSPVFTAYRKSDPDRVVVDLANVKPGEIADAIPVGDGRVEDIHVTAVDEQDGEAVTRVEIALSTASEHEVTAGPEGVVIALTPVGETAGAQDPWTAQGEEAAQSDEAETGAWAGSPSRRTRRRC